MSFRQLPKLILGGVRFEQPYREMYIYVAKSCVFLSETKIHTDRLRLLVFFGESFLVIVSL